MRAWLHRILVVLGLLSGLAACDAGPSAVLPDNQGLSPTDVVSSHSAPQTTPQAPKVEAAQPDASSNAPATLTEAAPVSLTATKYGQWPLWSSNRKYTAQENATYHFERHASEFGVKTYPEWIAFVHGFVHAPPQGTQILRRSNGDTLYYNASQNIFAVTTKAGAPRTLFRPDDGRAYWQRQKEIEANRPTLTRDNRNGED